MKILSLFDGISCARVALERAEIAVESYRASEIDMHVIRASKENWSDVEHVGSVAEVKGFSGIDLLIGGSPCQDLSLAKNGRKGLRGERSGLFWEYVRIMRETRPRWFVLENVASMSMHARDEITEAMGVQPIMIDASLVSGQSRKRYFWTNIPVNIPEGRNIPFQSALSTGTTDREKSYCIPATYYKENVKSLLKRKKLGLLAYEDGVPRKLSPEECETLQGLPKGYTSSLSMTQRYKTLGNAFNVDVVAHILSFIPGK